MLNNKKILLVEDDPLISRLYTKFLTRKGADIIIAFNGREGLNKLKDEDIDLVLLDLTMPDMDGFVMLERMREDDGTKDVLVMIITNTKNSPDDLKRLGKLGIEGYIEKAEAPLAMLAQAIDSHFNAHK